MKNPKGAIFHFHLWENMLLLEINLKDFYEKGLKISPQKKKQIQCQIKEPVCPTVILVQESVNHSAFPREYLLFSKRHRYRYHRGQQPNSVPKLKS